MKTIVVSDKDQTRIPFLRGILVRSLLDAGLDFGEAYKLATDLREELADTEEITANEVRERISALLESHGHLGAVDRIHGPADGPPAQMEHHTAWRIGMEPL